MNQFIADTGALTGWQGILDGVSGQVNSFKDSFAGPSDLRSSHGAIGYPLQNVVDGVLSSRDGALGATQVATGRMAELLGQASQAYARGDLEAGDRLKAQADQLEGAGAPATAGGGGADAASAASGGAGQMMGQFSQLAGQMAQSITQPLQGLAQVPQQVMQGVQGIVESAMQAAGGGADAAGTAADAGGAEQTIKAADHRGPGEGPGGPADQHEGKDDEKSEADRDRPAGAGAAADGRAEQVGNRASAGVAPEDGFGVGPAPAQIRNINPKQQ
ncbi:type VII secretion target [Mycolicibacterium boenickei]